MATNANSVKSVNFAKNSGISVGAFVPTLLVLGVLVLGVVAFADFWTELKWFEQLAAARVFWTQYGAGILFGAAGAVFSALVVSLSFRAALGKKVAKLELKPADVANPPSKTEVQLAQYLNSGRRYLFYLIPIAVGGFFGANLGYDWRTFLLWWNGSSFGKTDPEFGNDVGFYVFTLPVLQELLAFFLGVIILSAVAGLVGYWLNGVQDYHKESKQLSLRARIHLAVVLAALALVVAGNLWLARYDLLLANRTRFSGASFTDVNANLPALTILTVSVLLVAVLLVVSALRGTWKPAVVGIVTTVVCGLVLTNLYPMLVQNFKVNPNAAELESEYIQRNIDATLAAYGLEDVEKTQYAARTDAQSGQLRQDSETAAQIRLLDPTVVSPSFNQLQQNRQYYQFTEKLSVDRYQIGEETRDTVIAVRELNLDGLDDSRRSWVNDHTVFTHGFGVAAAYGNTMTTKGDPAFWEAGIPSAGEMGEYESRVYFGQHSPSYSIVGAPAGSEPWELDYPDDKAPNGQMNTTFTGDGGPKITNTFEKLLFAIKFRSTELFFSDRVTDKSQILYDRDPHKRIAKVAPYLTLDSKALPAVVDMDANPDTPKELVWIVDGFTTSNHYPYSARSTLDTVTQDAVNRDANHLNGPEQINYIRNSVKAIVNAYDGKVTLYQWDQKDPIINAWKKVFPGQITELKEMPGDLIAHVRYPEDLFKVQRSLLARYHVTDAKSFYSGGDFWQIPREPTMQASANTPAQPAYYMTLQMPGQDKASFSITTSYIPGGNTNRNVMTGFLAADSNAGNEKGKIASSYGKLRLLETPRDLTVPGPGQAENTMLTNPDVSTALNLLRQGGTNVREGNLLSLPVGGGLLYVQPIYVQAASGTQYPTLQYVLALFGDQVGFAPTLTEALDQVFGGDSGVRAGDAAIVGDKNAPIQNGAGSVTKPDTGTQTTPDTAADSAADSADSSKGTGTAQERLTKALEDARSALSDSETARKDGNWAAYGTAQERLAKAIQAAITAQEELNK